MTQSLLQAEITILALYADDTAILSAFQKTIKITKRQNHFTQIKD